MLDIPFCSMYQRFCNTIRNFFLLTGWKYTGSNAEFSWYSSLPVPKTDFWWLLPAFPPDFLWYRYLLFGPVYKPLYKLWAHHIPLWQQSGFPPALRLPQGQAHGTYLLCQKSLRLQEPGFLPTFPHILWLFYNRKQHLIIGISLKSFQFFLWKTQMSPRFGPSTTTKSGTFWYFLSHSLHSTKKDFRMIPQVQFLPDFPLYKQANPQEVGPGNYQVNACLHCCSYILGIVSGNCHNVDTQNPAGGYGSRLLHFFFLWPGSLQQRDFS